MRIRIKGNINEERVIMNAMNTYEVFISRQTYQVIHIEAETPEMAKELATSSLSLEHDWIEDDPEDWRYEIYEIYNISDDDDSTSNEGE